MTTALAALLAIASPAPAHVMDHPGPGFTTGEPLGTTFNSEPAGSWELLTTLPTGNRQTDLDFFEQQGETYASVGTLAAGANGAGQSIVRLTENGEISRSTPRFLTGHPSAECGSNPADALGLQHDVEDAPPRPARGGGAR